jgi:DNA-binding CsgD family transcriptional regulator
VPHLSRSQEAARRRIASLAGAGLLPEQLGENVLSALSLAIPADVQMLFGVDPGSLLISRVLAVTRGESAHTLRWLQEIYLAREPAAGLTFPGLMRARITAVALADRPETSWGAPSHLFGGLSGAAYRRLYHEIGTPAGGALRACFAADGGWIAALQLLRLDGGHPFQPTDVAFLRLLGPAIGRLLRSSFAREQAAGDAAVVGPGASGVLVLGSDGRISVRTAPAEAWLGLVPDALEPGSSGRPALPTAVWSAVARLRAGTDCLDERDVVVPTYAGPVRLEASWGSEDGSVVVVLTPNRPPRLTDLPIYWPLTEQERRVLALLVRGLAGRQIATVLGISEHTVESHRTNAFGKLEVGSRNQFLLRFFREAYGPALRPGIDHV